MYEAFMADYGLMPKEVDERFSFRQICEVYKSRIRRINEERKFQADLINGQNKFIASLFGVEVTDPEEEVKIEQNETQDLTVFGIKVIEEGGGSDE